VRSGYRFKAKCPVHADASPSLIIWTGRDGRPGFYCAAGCDWHLVADELRARGCVIRGRGASDQDLEFHKETQRKIVDDEQRRVDLAKTVWNESQNANGTAAERYLAQRGLELPPDPDRIVRYHRACWRGRERFPAMIVRLVDPVTDAFRGISRTFLTSDGRRDGPKMILGRAGVAKLSKLASEELNACEGFETGLALWCAGVAPVWSFGSAGNLERCPILPVVLTAYLDNDASRTGWRAGQRLAAAWGQGRVRLVMTDATGSDFADVL
jgi:putative DNA primase/helicase